MPSRPLRPCSHPGCARPSTSGRCEQHPPRPRDRTAYFAAKNEKAAAVYDREWRMLSLAYRAEHPTCEACGREKSRDCHHRIPATERPDLRLDPANLIAVCRGCHVVLDRAAGRARYWGR